MFYVDTYALYKKDRSRVELIRSFKHNGNEMITVVDEDGNTFDTTSDQLIKDD